MLDRLTMQVQMPHLAKLLATYEMHKDSRNSALKDYFLIFECADSTLDELWCNEKLWLKKSRARVELANWVATQCQVLSPFHFFIPLVPFHDPSLNQKSTHQPMTCSFSAQSNRGRIASDLTLRYLGTGCCSGLDSRLRTISSSRRYQRSNSRIPRRSQTRKYPAIYWMAEC
jgi:hypothetical protein